MAARITKPLNPAMNFATILAYKIARAAQHLALFWLKNKLALFALAYRLLKRSRNSTRVKSCGRYEGWFALEGLNLRNWKSKDSKRGDPSQHQAALMR